MNTIIDFTRDTVTRPATGTLHVAVAEGNHAALAAALERHGLPPDYLTMAQLLDASADTDELLGRAGISLEARIGTDMYVGKRVPCTQATLRREAVGWSLVALTDLPACDGSPIPF